MTDALYVFSKITEDGETYLVASPVEERDLLGSLDASYVYPVNSELSEFDLYNAYANRFIAESEDALEETITELKANPVFEWVETVKLDADTSIKKYIFWVENEDGETIVCAMSKKKWEAERCLSDQPSFPLNDTLRTFDLHESSESIFQSGTDAETLAAIDKLKTAPEFEQIPTPTSFGY